MLEGGGDLLHMYRQTYQILRGPMLMDITVGTRANQQGRAILSSRNEEVSRLPLFVGDATVVSALVRKICSRYE